MWLEYDARRKLLGTSCKNSFKFIVWRWNKMFTIQIDQLKPASFKDWKHDQVNCKNTFGLAKILIVYLFYILSFSVAVGFRYLSWYGGVDVIITYQQLPILSTPVKQSIHHFVKINKGPAGSCYFSLRKHTVREIEKQRRNKEGGQEVHRRSRDASLGPNVSL